MIKALIAATVLGGAVVTTALPAEANGYNSSTSYSNSTTVINTTTNNTVINNRYGRGRYNNRYKNPYGYGYKRPVYHPPSNQIQFRVPVRLNIFGSNIDLNIDSQGYPNYYRH